VRHWEFVSELPTAAQDGTVTLNGSHSIEDRRISFSKNLSVSLFNLPNFSRISLDSTFKKTKVTALLAFLSSFNFQSSFFHSAFALCLFFPHRPYSKNFVSLAFFSFSPNTSSALPLLLFPCYFFLF
jgi:hypothetical protein